MNDRYCADCGQVLAFFESNVCFDCSDARVERGEDSGYCDWTDFVDKYSDEAWEGWLDAEVSV